MNYDERMAYLKDWFKSDIITRFAMPRDLEPKMVAMDVIDTINANIPSGVNEQRMALFTATITKEATRNARTRVLPTAKEFLEATKTATRSGVEARTAPSTYISDPFALTAKTVLSGGAISDTYLSGSFRDKLINEYGITDADLAPYDKYISTRNA